LRSNRNADGLSVDFSQNLVQEKAEWTPGLQDAVQHNDIIEQNQSGQRVIAAPLRVRGQVIGAMEFELDEHGQLSPEDIELVQEVSERFGLAVENARLFDQSQRVAQREALINEIGSRLQQTNNVETTLAQAAQSLKQALRANKVSIRLGPPPSGNGVGDAS
jgi:transcriptional regulator with GAF, ATPase, and Fis domain